jgi:hypothetical protein
MARDVGVSDESLNRWLKQPKPRRVEEDNQELVAAWFARTRQVPYDATLVAPMRVAESGAAYVVEPPIAVRPEDVDGVYLAVEAMSHTISRLLAAARTARGATVVNPSDPQAPEVAATLPAAMRDAPPAPAHESRRRAGGG